MSNSQKDAGYVWEPEFKGFRLPENHSIDKCRAMDLTQKIWEQPEDTVDPVTKEVTVHEGVLLATASTSVLAQRARQTGGSQSIYEQDGLESVKQAQPGTPQPQGGFVSNPYFPGVPTEQTMPAYVAPVAGPGGAPTTGVPSVQQQLDAAQFGQYPNEQQVQPGQPNAQLPNMPHNAQQHELIRQQVGPDPMPLGPQVAMQGDQPQAPQGARVKFVIPLVGEIDAAYANVFLSKPNDDFLILISDNRSGQFAFKPPVNRDQPLQIHVNGGEFSCWAWSHGIHWTYPDGSLSFLTLIIDNTWANRQQQQQPQEMQPSPPGGVGL